MFGFGSATAGTQFAYSTDGGSSWLPSSGSASLSNLPIGSHTIYVRALYGGLISTASPASYTWVVDTTTPGDAISCLTAADAGPDAAGWFTAAPTCTVTGSDTVPGSGIQQVHYTVYGPNSSSTVYATATTTSADSEAVTISQTGTYMLATTVTNDAGTTTTRTQTLRVDTNTVAAPVINSPAAGAYQNNTHPTFAGTGTPGDTVTVYVDGTVVGHTTVGPNGTWSVVSSVALADGTHAATATEADQFGKTGPASAPRDFGVGSAPSGPRVDTTPPSPPVVSTRPPASTTAGHATFSFSPTAGGASYRYSLDGGRWVDGGLSYSVSGLRPGLHRLAVETVSPAGVVSAETVITWRVYPKRGAHGLPTRARVLANAEMTASTAKGVDVLVSLNAGSIRRASVLLYHDRRLIGQTTRDERFSGHMRLYVRVLLNAYGRRVLAHSRASGVAIQVYTDIKPFAFRALGARADAHLYVPYATVALTVHFANASARLSAAAQRDLRAHVAELKRVRDILVIGNTDSYGAIRYNYSLGLRRAEAVIGYLRRYGVDARMTSVTNGPSKPVATNKSAGGRALNRNATASVTYYDVG